MTTQLTNIFTSARLLVAAVSSILLLGILAPVASGATSDVSMKFRNTPLVGPQSGVTSFDAPAAGTGAG